MRAGLSLPFVMYADFVSVLVNQNGFVHTTDKSWIEKVERHVPVVLVCT